MACRKAFVIQCVDNEVTTVVRKAVSQIHNKPFYLYIYIYKHSPIKIVRYRKEQYKFVRWVLPQNAFGKQAKYSMYSI